MFIKTENNGIINTHHFDRIDVYSEENGTYTLRTYTNPIPDSINAESLSIAVFDNKAEADSALLNLLRHFPPAKTRGLQRSWKNLCWRKNDAYNTSRHFHPTIA